MLRHYRCAALFLGLLTLCGLGVAQLDRTIVVDVCGLLRDPGRYDGQRVTVSASYRYGFEWQELFCMKCWGGDRVWLEIPTNPPEALTRALRGTPKHEGIANGKFTGIFRGKPGAFGDGGYRFQLEVESVTAVKTISRKGVVPTALPVNLQRRLCQGSEARKPR